MADKEAGLDWKFSQVFGDKNPVEDVTDVDIVSAIEFDETGKYLGVGDRGGRVVVFEAKESTRKAKEYKFYAEFQSHEPEFDYLKSLEIEEKINKIKWWKQNNSALFLLTTNDKTVKLWKVHEKRIKSYTNTLSPNGGCNEVTLPSMEVKEVVVAATPRRIFSNAHAYHINSVSLNSDGETYISSDDLRINLWNLAINDQSFNIVDIKPANMEELTEVITSAEFHPTHCGIFMYSSSKGIIKLGDMRDSALCDQHAKIYEEEEDPGSKSFFSEIISSISDIKFSSDGRHIVSRDYLTLKIWDMNMESKPVRTIKIHDFLRSKLCDLYENDCIFDKFECHVSGDSKHLVTGSYNNNFYVYDWQRKSSVMIEASKGSVTKTRPRKGSTPKGRKRKDDINPDHIDFAKKCLHVAWHPKEDVVAVGASNNLYLYHGEHESPV
mmetsp:Transcript_51447/g.129076  ORF Transcript_51447/g.129076 Transcript_51447/m.129076 type:complete len:438 (+) Transcript_51447:246-1559(+)|eukprot:CAMPEP_0177655124 /NCGR_PEP_ID=MMETSP0447-20121125/14764_1 /TAXON_ID=0 /ORGANISM="Stygamoeba regulata, Strain BSH-02190019" /LENGTH=437 /DNA_ID=CAMNT_0019158951 /DNA_START=242 /DNA_END=1555 /DNA_ORIENTATION=-